MIGKLVHIGVDAVLISALLAGMKRSTGLTFRADKFAGNDSQVKTYIDKYLSVGEWVMDQSVAIAGTSSYFERKR